MTTLQKPVKRVARSNRVPHGVTAEIVVTLYPAGIGRPALVGLKELRRIAASEVTIEVGDLYTLLVMRRATAARGYNAMNRGYQKRSGRRAAPDEFGNRADLKRALDAALARRGAHGATLRKQINADFRRGKQLQRKAGT